MIKTINIINPETQIHVNVWLADCSSIDLHRIEEDELESVIDQVRHYIECDDALPYFFDKRFERKDLLPFFANAGDTSAQKEMLKL